MSDHESPSFVMRLIQRAPIIGYAIRCLEEELHEQAALFGANLVMAALLAVLILGFPAFITVVLSATLILRVTFG